MPSGLLMHARPCLAGLAFTHNWHPDSLNLFEPVCSTPFCPVTLLSCGGCPGMQAVLRPVAQPGGGRHVLFEHFWVEVGDLPLPEPSSAPQFVMTPSVRGHLRSLARAVLVRRFPILLQASAAPYLHDHPTYAASARVLHQILWPDAIRQGSARTASVHDFCLHVKSTLG